MEPRPLIFIGLVTHPQTRFKDSQTASGVASRLGATFRHKGVGAITAICAENLGTHSVSRYTTAQSKIAERTASLYWDYYLEKQSPPIHKVAAVVHESLGEATKDFFCRKAQTATQRLVNIELAHLSLMQKALTAKASWAIIIEDDATCDNIEDLADGILGIIDSSHKPSYFNLSRSFTAEEIKIDKLLAIDPYLEWAGAEPRSILRATLPITNTVCAVAYEANFLREIMKIMADMGPKPVLPIDWKLNMALIKLGQSKSLLQGYRGCLFVEPGPLIQRSLHPTL